MVVVVGKKILCRLQVCAHVPEMVFYGDVVVVVFGAAVSLSRLLARLTNVVSLDMNIRY